MSLLKKVKSGLSKRIEVSKEQRQAKQIKQAALNKKIEEARWSGYEKGALSRARSEGLKQGKAKSSGGGILGKFDMGAGLNFLNQDFNTAFSGKSKAKHHVVKHEGKTGTPSKGVTIHVDGTTIHVGAKGKKATQKKKKQSSMFNLF